MKSYLANHMQCIEVGDTNYELELIKCGVPGPLLFPLYINNMIKYFINYFKLTLFADVTSLYNSCKNRHGNVIFINFVIYVLFNLFNFWDKLKSAAVTNTDFQNFPTKTFHNLISTINGNDSRWTKVRLGQRWSSLNSLQTTFENPFT